MKEDDEENAEPVDENEEAAANIGGKRLLINLIGTYQVVCIRFLYICNLMRPCKYFRRIRDKQMQKKRIQFSVYIIGTIRILLTPIFIYTIVLHINTIIVTIRDQFYAQKSWIAY